MEHLPSDIAYRWLSYDAGQAQRWQRMLSEEEQQRVQTFKHPGRCRAFTTGRVAARMLVAERLAMAPEHVPLQVAEDGGVDVVDAGVHLSIAHSGPHAVAALGDRRIGVDLEHITPRRPDLRRFILHPDEYPLLDALPLDEAHSQILCWTLKEATLKAMRTGFRCSPKKLHLAIDLPRQAATVQVEEGACWQLRFEQRGAYFLAVAFGG